MSNHKMKNLLKGLRYISQIFENDQKEPEMQIGLPTDVKHVAHIGWDGGGSANPPTWMDEFKEPTEGEQTPRAESKGSSSVKGASEGARDMPGLPKSSKSRSSSSDSPRKEKTEKPRRRSLNQDGSMKPSRKAKDSSGQSSSNPPDVPKKSRRHKSKSDSKHGGSTRSSGRSRGSGDDQDCMSDTSSIISMSQIEEESEYS